MIIFIVVFSEMRLMFICFSFSFSVLCKSAAEQVYVRFETNFVFLWRLFCLTITHGFLFGPKCPNDICFVILFFVSASACRIQQVGIYKSRRTKKRHKYLAKDLCKFQCSVWLTVRIRDGLKCYRGVKDQLVRCTVSWPLNRLHVWPLIHCH